MTDTVKPEELAARHQAVEDRLYRGISFDNLRRAFAVAIMAHTWLPPSEVATTAHDLATTCTKVWAELDGEKEP